VNPRQQYWVVASECWQRRGERLAWHFSGQPSLDLLKTPRCSGLLGLAPGWPRLRCLLPKHRNELFVGPASPLDANLWRCQSHSRSPTGATILYVEATYPPDKLAREIWRICLLSPLRNTSTGLTHDAPPRERKLWPIASFQIGIFLRILPKHSRQAYKVYVYSRRLSVC